MEITGRDEPIELTGNLRLDLAEVMEKTLHRQHMLTKNRGLRCCYLYHALPEYLKLQFGSIGRLCRFLMEDTDGPHTPRILKIDPDVDFVTTDVRSDSNAPPPPPGKEVRAHRDVTIFFSTRDPS